MIPRTDVLIGNLTHVGMERSENQDYYGYYEPEDDAEFKLKGRLIIVCDGMGGHAGGEVASRLAVNTIVETFKNDNSGNVLEALRGSIEAANRAIWRHAQEKTELKGMGSTCVSMAVKDGTAYFGHVGDSRCYLIRSDQLSQVTKDHSLVQQMVDEGLLREEEMESHPEKNVILRSLGVKPDVDVEITSAAIQPGDIYCLSSDGLTGLVSKEECRRICLLHKDNPMEAARLLVDLANKYGGYDNVTVQIVRVLSLKPGEAPAAPSRDAQTGVYSEEDVNRSIAEARAKAAAAPVKMAPTAAEMTSNKPKAGGQQKGITMALAAPSRDEIEKAKREALAAQQSAKAAPAPTTRPNVQAARGSSLVKNVAIAAVALVALGFFALALRLQSRTFEAREKLRDAIAKAENGNPDLVNSETYKSARQRAEDAMKKAQGFLGGFTAAHDLEDARSELEKAIGDKNTSGVNAEGARAHMETAQQAAEKAGAPSAAQVDWDRANHFSDAGKTAFKSEDAAEAARLYQRAEDAYRRAEIAALDAKARTDVEAAKASVAAQLASPEGARAKEFFAELIQEAKASGAEAEQLQATDPQKALADMRCAEIFVKKAIAVAPEIEKKN